MLPDVLAQPSECCTMCLLSLLSAANFRHSEAGSGDRARDVVCLQKSDYKAGSAIYKAVRTITRIKLFYNEIEKPMQ